MDAHHELLLPTQPIMLYDITVKRKWMYNKDDIGIVVRLAEMGYLKLGKLGGIKTMGVFPLELFDAALDAAANRSGPWLQAVIAP